MTHIDWQDFHAAEDRPTPAVDPRRRLRICLAGFAVLVLVVFGRAVQLEVTQGAAFRSEACKPLQRAQSLPGVRGRILAHDGTVLAFDKEVLAVAVHYRYLQEPPDARWLRAAARSRLPKPQRKDAERVAAEEERLRIERAELARRLARLCGLSAEDWHARTRLVQTRVERIAKHVNAAKRRQEPLPPETVPGSFSLPQFIEGALRASLDDSATERVTVAEELDYHVMAEDVPLGAAAEIEGNPQQYPGVKILTRTRRAYPAGSLAAHVLGHLAPVEKEELKDRAPLGSAAVSAAVSGGQDARAPHGDAPYSAEDYVGRMGVERQYESLLRARRGVSVELTDHTGRAIASFRAQEPGAGRDLVLTLDSRLQRAAEELLDSAVKRREMRAEQAAPAGGAIVVMDVRTGALRALAAAPRFDPNWFVAGKTEELASLQNDPCAPLFDRACRMAIAPGSVFKTVTAVALLESGAVDAHEPLLCQGYLHEPDQQRCEIYVRHGKGHGDVTLSDALCVSCNVYFFHHAGHMGASPLVDWAEKFGFGRTTGVDLPGEAAGTLPGEGLKRGTVPLFSIGQGPLTATPLQVACLMAAVANGGQLVTPHVVSGLGLPEKRGRESFSQETTPDPFFRPPRPIPGLTPQTLEIIRAGLNRVVADPAGTAYGTVRLETVMIAGKTGTAETGGDRAPHAWFAGYVPAEKPKLALVVVLEHAGSGATAAGPVAKRLVLRMQQLGML